MLMITFSDRTISGQLKALEHDIIVRLECKLLGECMALWGKRERGSVVGGLTRPHRKRIVTEVHTVTVIGV